YHDFLDGRCRAKSPSGATACATCIGLLIKRHDARPLHVAACSWLAEPCSQGKSGRRHCACSDHPLGHATLWCNWCVSCMGGAQCWLCIDRYAFHVPTTAQRREMEVVPS